MTLPALAGLRSLFPTAQIDVMARPWSAPVYSFCHAADQVIEHDKPSGFAPFGKLLESAAKIKDKGYDVALTFPNSFESALIFRLAGIPKIYGYNTDFRSTILTRALDVPQDKKEKHEVFYYLNLVKGLFCSDDHTWKNELLKIKLAIPETEKQAARELLHALGCNPDMSLIGINPGAAYGPAKCWPTEKYRQLAQDLLDTFPDAMLLVFGTRDDMEAGKMITQPVGKRGINLCGKTTLKQAIAIIDDLDFMVTNDSGLMHVAAACSVPIVALFGSTNPVTTGPWTDRALVVRHELPCSPCLNRDCPRDFICMAGISVDEVLEACQKILQ